MMSKQFQVVSQPSELMLIEPIKSKKLKLDHRGRGFNKPVENGCYYYNKEKGLFIEVLHFPSFAHFSS